MANDASIQHEHRWFVQDEDEPANTYLVCIQCGEVVDPPTFLAMREIVQQVANLPAARDDSMGDYCVFCELDAVQEAPGKWPMQHKPDCPVTKAIATVEKQSGNQAV